MCTFKLCRKAICFPEVLAIVVLILVYLQIGRRFIAEDAAIRNYAIDYASSLDPDLPAVLIPQVNCVALA